MKNAAFICVALLAATAVAEPASYIVIANPHTSLAPVDRKFLEDVFLRRTTRWPDDTPIRPVDLAPESRARTRFSEEVLSRSVSSVRSYWQQRIFSGQGLPPPELSSDDAVVSYVLSHAGAIGYVTAGTPLNGARVLEVR